MWAHINEEGPMRISDLIRELREVRDKHGNLVVFSTNQSEWGVDWFKVKQVEVRDYNDIKERYGSLSTEVVEPLDSNEEEIVVI
jgi:hypothetical protein